MTPATRYPGVLVATRSIVTSQPDVACDVCMRRLLRGERPDVFLASGRRLTVCELCAPRAAHEGWMRERDVQAVTLPPARPRRARGFIDRLRGRGEQAELPPFDPPSPLSASSGVPVVGAEMNDAPRQAGALLEVEIASVREPVAEVLPVGGSPAGISALAESPEMAEAADGPAEEGSWRDAWMFVTE